MTPHEYQVLIGVVAAIGAALFLLGRYWWPSLKQVRRLMAGELDDAWDDGWDDRDRSAKELTREMQDVIKRLQEELRECGQTVMLDGSIPLRGAGEATQLAAPPPRALAQGESTERLHDWRQQIEHDLSDEHIQEDLPGPAPLLTVPDRAGEFHDWALEPPLPAVLMLGQEGDGTDRTWARVRLRQMTAINRTEEARRVLCEECGIKFVPMELVAVAA